MHKLILAILVGAVAPAQAMVGGTIKRLATPRSITLLTKPTRTFCSAPSTSSTEEKLKKMAAELKKANERAETAEKKIAGMMEPREILRIVAFGTAIGFMARIVEDKVRPYR